MTLRLATPLISLNQMKGQHWGAWRTARSAWVRELSARGTARLAPRTPPEHRQTVTVVRLLQPRQRPLDADNLAGGNAKALIDVLTTYGFWRDDSPRWLDREYQQRRATPEERREGVQTLVLIEEALA